MIDHWSERIHCPVCRKIGSADFTQGNGDDVPGAIASDGFKVVKTEYGPIFQCEACIVQVVP